MLAFGQRTTLLPSRLTVPSCALSAFRVALKQIPEGCEQSYCEWLRPSGTCLRGKSVGTGGLSNVTVEQSIQRDFVGHQLPPPRRNQPAEPYSPRMRRSRQSASSSPAMVVSLLARPGEVGQNISIPEWSGQIVLLCSELRNLRRL